MNPLKSFHQSRLRLTTGLLLLLPLVAAQAQTDGPPGGQPTAGAIGIAGENAAPAGLPAPKPDPAVEKFWDALRLLESKSPADLVAGRVVLQAASDLEYGHAQTLLGNCLLSGSYGFAKEPRKAANLFRLAAERGNAFAMVSLGTCYATGTGVKQDDLRAEGWLTAALAPAADYSRPTPPATYLKEAGKNASQVAGELANDPLGSALATAHFLLGQIHSRRNQPAEAQTHYVAAATAGPEGRSGIYPAAVEAALNYAFGRGIPRDPVKAREMIDQSRRLNARQGVNLIHNYVSLKIIDDFAVADLEESVSAAGAGQQGALQLQIAQSLANKNSKDYNAAEAAQWYELAAENGQVWAMLSLALLHARGELGPPDLAKAFHWFEQAGGGDKPKHLLGVANLAICLQNGLGTPKDSARAAALFERHRDGDMICYLGSIGQCPAAPLSFEEEVSLNETWARVKDDHHAQFLLGVRYLNGWGVKTNRDEALKWFKKAGKAGHGAALCQLGVLTEFTPINRAGITYVPQENLEKAVDYYRQGAEAGDPDAIANYANMLYGGRGVPRDAGQAEKLYLKCLQLKPDHARAHCNLAVFYADVLTGMLATYPEDKIKVIRAKMLEHYEASAQQQFAYAARNLGDLYYLGKLVPQDLKKAYVYFEQAAEWGLPLMHYSLGYMHEFGLGVPVTYTEAAYHYRLAALEGNLPALQRLVNFYITGTGVSSDLDRAIFWLQQMIRLGHSRSLLTVCDLLIKKGDFATVVPLLRKLVDSSDKVLSGFAYHRLALCYAEGQGVKRDAGKAKKYMEEAVRLGDADALTARAMGLMAAGNIKEAIANFELAAPNSGKATFALGQMYFFGTNVTLDKPKALRLIRQAGNMNNPDALYFLAVLTNNRDSAAPPLDEAITFALKAENLGHPKAAELREKLEKRRKDQDSRPEEESRSRAS